MKIIKFALRLACLQFFLFGLSGGFSVHAQIQNASDGLLKRCGGYFGLCGYISEAAWKNERREVEVLPQDYEDLGEFSEGLAPVRVQGRWGFMDRKGVMKITPTYTSVSPFDYGYAVVGTEKGYGLIDKSGDLRLLPKFTWLVIYNETTVIASLSESESYDPYNRSRRYTEKYSGVDLTYAPPAGIYNIKKGWVTAQNLKFERFDAEINAHIWAKEEGQGNQYGLLNSVNGKWVVPPAYDEVRDISEGLAVIGKFIDGKPKTWGNKLYGMVDQSGQLVIPLKFDHLNDVWYGFGETRKDGKIALVTKSGNLVADKYFEDAAFSHSDRTQRMVKDRGEWWEVWPNGSLQPEEGTVFLTCPSGLSFEGYMERTVITHPDGRILGDDFKSPKQRLNTYFTNEITNKCETPISVQSAEGKWGFISPGGEFLAGGLVYDNTLSFKEGLGGRKYSGFRLNGLWGIMNDEGDVIEPPKFKSSSEALDNIPGYIPRKTGLETGSQIKCAAGSRLFMASGKWGLQDEIARVLVKAEHDLLTCFSGGTAFVPDYDLKQWCHIDREGKRRPDLPCQTYYQPSYRSHASPEVLDPDPWLSNVKWVRQYYEYGLGLRDTAPKLIPWE